MKKIIAVVVALTMVMALSVSAFALEGTIDVALFVCDNVNWATVHGDPVTINGAGDYTVSITGLNVGPKSFASVYIKDMAAYADESASDISDFVLSVKSCKINGVEVEVTDGWRNTRDHDGQLDACFVNMWDEAYYIAIPDETVKEIEFVFNITDADAPADESENTPEPETTPEPEATTEPDAAKPETTSNPEATSETTAPKTGLALAVVPAVMALAAAAVTKKR